MRNKIIEFFHRNRIIDSYIGIWQLHIWLYLFATYFDMYVIGISIYLKRFCIFNFTIELNKRGRLFEVTFKILNMGFDTSRKHMAEVHRQYEEMCIKEAEAFEAFKKTLTKEELVKAIRYKELS